MTTVGNPRYLTALNTLASCNTTEQRRVCTYTKHDYYSAHANNGMEASNACRKHPIEKDFDNDIQLPGVCAGDAL